MLGRVDPEPEEAAEHAQQPAECTPQAQPTTRPRLGVSIAPIQGVTTGAIDPPK